MSAKPGSVLTWATNTNFAASSQPWASSATKVQPASGVQAEGHNPEDPVVAQYENWYKNQVGLWFQYLNDGAFTGGVTIDTLNGALTLAGVISPAALGLGPTNDWNPSGLSTTYAIRLPTSGGGANVITGIVAQPAGRLITIYQVSTGGSSIQLNNEAAGSAAANRFLLPNAANLTIPSDGAATLWYDTTTARWRLHSKNF